MCFLEQTRRRCCSGETKRLHIRLPIECKLLSRQLSAQVFMRAGRTHYRRWELQNAPWSNRGVSLFESSCYRCSLECARWVRRLAEINLWQRSQERHEVFLQNQCPFAKLPRAKPPGADCRIHAVTASSNHFRCAVHGICSFGNSAVHISLHRKSMKTRLHSARVGRRILDTDMKIAPFLAVSIS
jgi:hypothetical protein